MIRRPIVWLVEVSFCYFLVHQLVIRVYHQLVATPDIVTVVVTFVVSVAAAVGLDYLVERPGYGLLKGSPNPVVEGPSASSDRGAS